NAPRPAHRDGVVEFLRRPKRGRIKDAVVEEAEVESHLPIGAHQAGLALEACVRPVLGMQPMGLRAGASWREDRRRYQWRAGQQIDRRRRVYALHVLHPHTLAYPTSDALQHAHQIRRLHEGTPASYNVVIGVTTDD